MKGNGVIQVQADRPAMDSDMMSLSKQLYGLLDDGVRCIDADRRCHFNDWEGEQAQASLLDTCFIVSQAEALQGDGAIRHAQHRRAASVLSR